MGAGKVRRGRLRCILICGGGFFERCRVLWATSNQNNRLAATNPFLLRSLSPWQIVRTKTTQPKVFTYLTASPS